MTTKLKAIGMTGLVAAGALGNLLFDTQKSKIEPQDVATVVTDDSCFFGFEIKGSYFDQITSGRITNEVCTTEGYKIGSIYTDFVIARKKQNGKFTDTLLTRSTLSSDYEHIFMEDFHMHAVPMDAQSVKMIKFMPENPGGSKEINFGAGIGGEGFSLNAGSSISRDSMVMSQNSSIETLEYDVSYEFTPSVFTGKILNDSKTKLINNQCRKAVVYGAVTYQTEAETYDLRLMGSWQYQERIVGEMVLAMMFPYRGFRTIDLDSSSFDYVLHIGETEREKVYTDSDEYFRMMIEKAINEQNAAPETNQESATAEQSSAAETADTGTEPAVVPPAQQEDVQNDQTDTAPAWDTTAIAVPDQPQSDIHYTEQQQSPVVPALESVTDTAAGAIEEANSTPDIHSAADAGIDAMNDVFNITIGALNPPVSEPAAAYELNKDYLIVPCGNTDVAVTTFGAKNESSVTAEEIGTGSQRWHFEDAGDGSVYIVNSDSGLLLDMRVWDVNKIKNSTKVHLYEQNEAYCQTQCWKIVENNGKLTFVAAYNTKYRLDVYGDSICNGAQLQLYEANPATSGTQTFVLVPAN